jgi:hypothetical protein
MGKDKAYAILKLTYQDELMMNGLESAITAAALSRQSSWTTRLSPEFGSLDALTNLIICHILPS